VPTTRDRTWLALLLFVPAYVAAAKMGFLVAYVHPVVSPIWPPAGLAIALAMLVGPRAWPAVFAGAFLANAWAGDMPVPVALGIATGNALEAIAAATLVRRLVGPAHVLDHPQDVLAYVGLAALACAAGASIGVASLVAGGVSPGWETARLWLLWWQGDLGGAVVVAPVLLAYAERGRPAPRGWRLVEAMLLLAAIVGATWLAFGPGPWSRYPNSYLPIPLLVLATFRFGRLGATTGALVVLALAVANTAAGHGVLSAWSASESLLLLQLYTEVVAVTTLLLAAVLGEREAADASRREGLARLKAQQEGALDGILTVDENQRVIDYKRRFVDLWRIPDDVMATGDDRCLLAYVRDDVADFPAFMSRIAFLYGNPTVSGRDEIRLRDGRVIERWSTAAVDPGGRWHGRVWYFRDVTDRVDLADVLRRQNDRMKEIDGLKSTLVSAVSHELRTPLTSIVGYAEFLEDELAGPLTEAQAEYVGRIQAAARTLQRLVDDLLDFARLETGHFRLRRQDADLRATVLDVVAALRPQAVEARIALVAEVPDVPVVISMDPERIGQVVANLVGNAVKFTPPGGRVRCALREDADGAVVEVVDSGPGIAPEHLARLFDRFYQVDGGLTRAKGGAGLGLSIVKALVEAHGGRIGVVSRVGEGSRFLFSLPRHPLPAVAEVAGDETPAPDQA
jgi:signal transduction histidine kinase/integral membrane sensor domain MASE1